MVKDLSRKQEQRGTRRVFVWGIAAAAVVAIGVTVGPMLAGMGSHTPMETTGQATHQTKGMSVAGKTTVAPPAAGTGTNRESVGRANAITGSAEPHLHLRPQQRQAVDQYAAQHKQQMIAGDFDFSVGAAVPRKLELRAMPQSLVLQLPSYKGDRYFMVPKQFVIVEPQTKRVVAIIPLSAG
ncbi:MAG TPA: DUF1236 domain-containing protein [Pseudolabrys sp.]|nr:DUF1236 domain-containing protein [Pseudolabrys sp.]